MAKYLDETVFTIRVARFLEKKGWKIVKRSSVVYELFYREDFARFPKAERGCHFDLVCTHKRAQKLFGIEIKNKMTNLSFGQAIGQCLYYLTIKPELSGAKIVYNTFLGGKEPNQGIVSRFDLPIEVLKVD